MSNDTRVLVCAAESYAHAADLSGNLAGTSAAGFDFARWARDAKGVALSDMWLCTDSDLAADLNGVNKFGATRAQIREALVSLCGNGKNKTSQLLVFLSGHGFAYSTTAGSAPADMFVCSEYANLTSGGDACINIPELQEKVAYWIGGMDHFYFVDCCRNVIDPLRINPVNLALAMPGSDVSRPFVYTLYSTSIGATAFTGSGFTKYLLDGLCGKGRAKGWALDNTKMQVLFALVCEYVKKKVGRQRVDFRPGGGDGLILTLPSVPENECSIVVKDAVPEDVFQVQLFLKGSKFGEITVIHGSTGEIRATPEVYAIRVNHKERVVVQKAPPEGCPIDLYDSCEARFEMQEAERDSRPTPSLQKSYVLLNLPPNISADLLNLNTNKHVRDLVGSVTSEVDPGEYELTVLEDRIPIRSQSLTVIAGETTRPDVLSFPRSAARMSILRAIGSVAEDRVFDFSETLGPVANVDLGLWLSILGASKIIAPIDAFSKLRTIPTANFDHIAPGSAAIYVLAAFDIGKLPLKVAAHAGELKWHEARQIDMIEDVQEVNIVVDHPGPGILSVSAGKRPTETFVIHTVPNRATLVVLSHDPSSSVPLPPEQRHIRRYQYILPISGLSRHVSPELQDVVAAHTDLKSIRAMFNVQALFCSKRAVSFSDGSTSRHLWDDSLYGKWLDPMMSVVMCYEMIRRGRKNELKDQLQVVARNLWRYFKLPDSHAILNILGEQVKPLTPPLFLDGVIPFAESSAFLPFPSSKLDYASPWTTWTNVVER
jgi:hypothetical protein